MKRRRGRGRADSAEGLLGSLEYEAMRAVWAGSPVNVPVVLERINAGRAGEGILAYTTVMTILVRLHDKGYLTRTKSGRGYDYTPRYSEPELVAHLGQTEVRQLMDRFGSDVALAQFASVLRDADPALLAQLHTLASGVQDDG